MGLKGVNLKVFLVVLMAVYASAVIVTIIDDFTPNTLPLSVQNIANTDTTTKIRSSNGNATLGTERDQILTILPGTSNKVISSSIVAGQWSNAFLQDTAGWSIVQYDGFDNSSALSLNPGITNTGAGLDLSFSNSAYAFYFLVTADLAAYYQINIYGATTADFSSYAFIYDPLTYVDPIDEIIIPFADFTGTASFTDVHAIELILNVTDGTVKNPVDTAILLFGIFGYEAKGTVYYDCNQNGAINTNELPIVGATATLRDNNNNVLSVQTTNVNGTFNFRGLANGTYSICVTNTNATNTFPVSGCLPVLLQNGDDALGLLFGYTVATTIFPPADTTLECGLCNTTACLGGATGVGCGAVPTITSKDTVTGTCPQVISRTFSATGAPSVTQTITVVDTTAPTIVANATTVVTPCSNVNPTINTWISTRGGFTVTDCSSFTYTNDWNQQQITTCTGTTVTFTATDACANVARSTASYSITDNVRPRFTKFPTNNSSSCDINTNSDQAAFTTWLNNHGFATATDDCTATANLVWTNDNVGTISQSCNVVKPVTFTVTDGCGNSNSSSATYTVADNVKPTFTTPASNTQAACSSDVTSAFNTWISIRGGAVAVDNCAISSDLIWTPFNGVTPSGCSGSQTVTFTVTDPCGNFASTTATFSITGNTGPTITTQPSPLSVDCTDSNSGATVANWLASNGGAVATDGCTTVVWNNTFANIPSGNCNQATITFTACNLCTPQRCTSATTTLSIIDANGPVFDPVPTDAQSECGPSSTAAFTNWLSIHGGGSATDLCTPPQNIIYTNNYTGAPLSNGCNKKATVSFFATDSCGNRSPASIATFTISDNTPPSISNAEDLDIECDNTVNSQYTAWIADNGGADGSDACGSITWSNNGTQSVSRACSFSELVVFTATDSCGFSSSTSAVFSLEDTQPPVITVEAKDQQATCTSNFEQSLTNWLNSKGGAVGSDACSAITWTNNFEDLVGDCTQSAFVVFTASDACGFSDTTSATFTVVDTQAPSITKQAQAESVACDNNAVAAFTNFLATQGGAVAKDSCQPDSSLFWSNDLPTAPAQCGTVTVTFTVTDGCGASATTSAPFTVTDATGPSIDPQASDLTVECDGTGNLVDYSDWVSTRGGAVAIDTCSLALNWTSNAKPSGPVGCGKTTVTFTVTDGCLNNAKTTATYTVVDTQAPAIFPPATDFVVECDGTGNKDDLNTWVASHGGASAVDVCYGTALTWKSTVGAKSLVSCTNYTTYTFSVTDSCGNTAVTTARFGITDNFAPTITVPPSPLVLECGPTNDDEIESWVNAHAGAQAVDDCSSANWASDYVDEDLFGCYTIPVIFVAYDYCQNVAFSQTTLTIQDTVAPEFIDFPEDVTLPCDGDIDPRSTGFPGVSDDCTPHLVRTVTYSDSAVDLPSDPETPLCPGDHVITRTFSVTDVCGNTNTQSQIITVKIERSSGPCDNDCDCPEECCPIPDATDCLEANCLPDSCAPAFCAAVLCSCPLTTRDVTEQPLPVPFSEFPVQQCEPVYIFVNDDDNEPNGLESGDDNSVAVPQVMQFTDRAPTEKDRKEYRKTNRKQKRSFLDSILSFFF